MKKATLAALAMSLSAATSTHAEKPTVPRTELIVYLAVITASVDRCHFEIDSRIIGLDLLKELMLIEDAPPNGHYNMALGLIGSPRTPSKGLMARIRRNGARARGAITAPTA